MSNFGTDSCEWGEAEEVIFFQLLEASGIHCLNSVTAEDGYVQYFHVELWGWRNVDEEWWVGVAGVAMKGYMI